MIQVVIVILGMINKNEQEDEPEIITIRVIGRDQKQHVAEPHKDTCICGEKILRKKLRLDDYKLFSCYECTF